MRIFRLAAAGGTLLGLSSIGSAALGATTPAGGAVTAFVSNASAATQPIIITGAIGDHGTATPIDKNGKKDQNGAYVIIKLAKGGFEVNAVKLNQGLRHVQPKVNAATCSGWATGSGPVTVFNGSGLYKNISGTLKATATFAFIGQLENGKCNMKGKPVAQYSSIVVSGNVSF